MGRSFDRRNKKKAPLYWTQNSQVDTENASATTSKEPVISKRTKILNTLQECCISADDKKEDETLLLMGLRLSQHDSCILQLLEIDSDFDAVNKLGKSALHLAVKRPQITVAEELIKRGADINAQDKSDFTPLHYAAMRNHEAVCMLLYYGADTSLKCTSHNLSPFNFALCSKEFESSAILMPYYDNEDLFNDINYFLHHYTHTLKSLLKSHNADLIHLIWTHIDYDILTKLREPFLTTYLCHHDYSFSDWLECLRLILQSYFTVDLIEHFNTYIFKEPMLTFINFLFLQFVKNKTDRNNRMVTINMVLSLGTEIHVSDFYHAFRFFGFNAEFEALLYAADYDINLNSTFNFALLPFIFGLNDDFSTDTIIQLFHMQIEYRPPVDDEKRQDFVIHVLRFFSYSSYIKLYLLTLCSRNMYLYDRVIEKLQELPQFPSLLELSRNQSYLFIRNTFKVKKPYQFQDALKSLNLPQVVKDMIRFRVPIY